MYQFASWGPRYVFCPRIIITSMAFRGQNHPTGLCVHPIYKGKDVTGAGGGDGLMKEDLVKRETLELRN